MAGLLDFLAGSNDPSTADPNTGLVDAQKKQLAYSLLGQTGAALLAAGAPQIVGSGQMGQHLAQLGQIPGNVIQQGSQLAQQNAMGQRAQILRQKVEQEKAAGAYIQSPEYQQMLGQMPDVLKAQAMANIKAGDYGAATKIVGDWATMTARAQHEKYLADREANKAIMTHDAGGNPIAYYPMSNKVVPIGGTQDPAAAYGLGPSAPGPAPSLPDGTPISDATGAAPQANPYPNASINPNLPYNKAFGVGGATTYALGRVGGTLGGNPGPETALQNAAVANYDKMRTELLNEARAESPGSSRIKAAYNAINETLPVAGSAFHDAPYALKQLSAAKSSIDKELENTTRLFMASATKPPERAKLASDIMSLRKNQDNLKIVIDGLAQGQGGGKPGGGGRLRFNPATGKIE